MKNHNLERLNEIRNDAEGLLVQFGSGTVHHISKEDVRRAIEKLAHGLVEVCRIVMEHEDRKN